MIKYYDKKEDLKTMIFNDLISINSACEAAYRYIVEPNTIYDVDELKYSLLAALECSNSIENNVYNLMKEFYKELGEKESEQL